MWQIGKLDVLKGIAGETTMKMMHEEVGIRRSMFFTKKPVFTKKCVLKEKVRCDTSDIWIQNLIHKEDL
jgi:hypothetical protein